MLGCLLTQSPYLHKHFLSTSGYSPETNVQTKVRIHIRDYYTWTEKGKERNSTRKCYALLDDLIAFLFSQC